MFTIPPNPLLTFARRLRRTTLVLCALVPAVAAPSDAAPRFRSAPEFRNFLAVVPGQSSVRVFILHNDGDTPLTISSASLVAGDVGSFSTTYGSGEIAPGATDTVEVTFAPLRGGDFSAILRFDTNEGSDPATLAHTSVALRGQGLSPELNAVPDDLEFVSSGVGNASSDSFIVENTGLLDTLEVTSIVIGDSRFSATPTTFSVPPDTLRRVAVTYTATGTAPVTATLTIESNDYDQPSRNVSLMTTESPNDFFSARVALSRLDTLSHPSVGDTVSVLISLQPSATAITGVEAFLAYDSSVFAAADSLKPSKKRGLTQNTSFLINRTVSDGASGKAAHFSVRFGNTVSSNGELVSVDLVVKQPIPERTFIRIMNQAPLRNTVYVTSTGATVTLPAAGALSLGNRPPRIRPPQLVETEEGKTGELALRRLAVDAETPEDQLTWTFTQADSLVSTQVLNLPGSRIANFTPATGISGAIPVLATVEDSEGGRDSIDVVVFVADVNNPPNQPTYTGGPADGATEVTQPVTFSWSGGDPDPGDVVTYDFLLGTNEDVLPEVASDLATTSHEASDLAPGQTYFWQVVAKDTLGTETPGPTRSFTTEPDRVAPVMTETPVVSDVTATAAVVSWMTDEASDSRVRLATQPDLSDSASFDETVIDEMVTDHSVSLSDLSPGTDYFYRAVSADSSGNHSTDAIRTFTTSAVPLPGDLGDLNADRLVNFEDFLIFLEAFDTQAGDADYSDLADLDGDGAVNFQDFLVFATVFGTNYAAAARPAPAIGDDV